MMKYQTRHLSYAHPKANLADGNPDVSKVTLKDINTLDCY